MGIAQGYERSDAVQQAEQLGMVLNDPFDADIPALQSALLNESATLFRRKYYNNGSHAGFIIYMTDTAQNETDVSALRSALKSAKGPGNFRSLFMYAPAARRRYPTDSRQRGGGGGRIRLDQKQQSR
jgi:hypothetical protein